jgi:hypothetical protein
MKERKEANSAKRTKLIFRDTETHTHGSDVSILTIQDGPGVSVDIVHSNNVIRWYAYASIINHCDGDK